MSPRKINLGKIGSRRKAKKEAKDQTEKSGRAAEALSVPEEVGTAREMAESRGARSPKQGRSRARKTTNPPQPTESLTADAQSSRRPRDGVVDSLDTSGSIRARRLVVPDDVRAGYGLDQPR